MVLLTIGNLFFSNNENIAIKLKDKENLSNQYSDQLLATQTYDKIALIWAGYSGKSPSIGENGFKKFRK